MLSGFTFSLFASKAFPERAAGFMRFGFSEYRTTRLIVRKTEGVRKGTFCWVNVKLFINSYAFIFLFDAVNMGSEFLRKIRETTL